MIEIIGKFGTVSARRGSELLEQCYRLRHEIFVDRLNWEDLRKDDNREIDQFDNEDAVHVVCEIDGKVAAYSRLIPTDQPHLLSEVYPQLMGGRPLIRDPFVFEWTRSTVVPSKQEGVDAFSYPARELYLGIIEYCQSAGITGLIIEYHPILITRTIEIGFDVKPLALPFELNGSLVVPVHATITDRTLATCREFFGMDTSVLAIADTQHSEVPGRYLQ